MRLLDKYKIMVSSIVKFKPKINNVFKTLKKFATVYHKFIIILMQIITEMYEPNKILKLNKIKQIIFVSIIHVKVNAQLIQP